MYRYYLEKAVNVFILLFLLLALWYNIGVEKALLIFAGVLYFDLFVHNLITRIKG